MPLTASFGGRVYISFELSNKEKKLPFVCRDCGNPLTFVDAKLRIQHFRHQKDVNCQYSKESFEHLKSKEILYKLLKRKSSNVVLLEAEIGERRPDLLVTNGVGKKYAIEVQLSPITFGEWLARMRYYNQLSIPVVWLAKPPKINDRGEMRVSFLQKVTSYLNYGRFYWVDVLTKKLMATHLHYRKKTIARPSTQEVTTPWLVYNETTLPSNSFFNTKRVGEKTVLAGRFGDRRWWS